MEVVADLHLHSKYSRAVSSRMVLEEMAGWAQKKGIDLVGTADWTHPLWLKEIESKLEEVAPGLYKLKTATGPVTSPAPHVTHSLTSGGPRVGRPGSCHPSPYFLLATEIASIYSQGGKMRRIHNLILAPSFETVKKINAELNRRGVNLLSDGRPITGISSRDLVALVLDIDESCLVVPCHAWTPWFSLYGSKSGFDSIKECYQEMSEYIYAIETGLSSSPAMNWRVKDLDDRAIVSFSDAHSPEKLGREATVFQVKSSHQRRAGKSKVKSFDYFDIAKAIKQQGDWEVGYTIEFYPEEGKYHYTGHRNCGVRQSPEETKKLGGTCPVCGKPLTVGVMHRVQQLAGREVKTKNSKGKTGVIWNCYNRRPPYVMLVPLMEVIAEARGSTVHSQSVMGEYERLVSQFGSEFEVLLKTKIEKIGAVSGARVAEAVKKVRQGDLDIKPGYDGVFGEVKIWSSSTDQLADSEGKGKQMSLF